MVKPLAPRDNRFSKRTPSILMQAAVRQTSFPPTHLHILTPTDVTAA